MKYRDLIVLVLFACGVLGEVYYYYRTNDGVLNVSYKAVLFSTAANIDHGKGFFVDLDQAHEFGKLDKYEQANYKFEHSENPEELSWLGYGLIYFIVVGKKIFFWMGDVWAYRSFQILTHLTICTLSYFLFFKKQWQRYIFIILYGLNFFITKKHYEPFYYCWPVFTSFTVLYLITKREELKNQSLKNNILLGLMSAINIFVCLARPTVMPLILMFFGVTWFYRYRVLTVANVAIAVLIFSVFFHSTHRNPWFTAVVAIGCHPNPYQMEKYDDNIGWNMYEEKTGKKLDITVINNYIGNNYKVETAAEFSSISKEFYFNFLENHPFLALRNAVINTLQGFSYGYYVVVPYWVNLCSAVFGIFTIGVFLYSRQYLIVLAILGHLSIFSPYCPPLLTYHLAAYIILITGWLIAIEFFIEKYRKKPDTLPA